jgi:hypothetical protein
MRTLLVAALLTALGAQAQVHALAAVDLDKPGVLRELARAKPDDYRTVMNEVEHAQSLNCSPKTVLQRTRATPGKQPCPSYLIATSYPAKIKVHVLASKTMYTITVALDTSADRARKLQ